MTLRLKLVSHSPKIPDLEITTEDWPVVLGRSLSSDAPVLDSMVSRRHCELDVRDGSVLIRDLGSTNGTIVNGDTVNSEIPLTAGDELLLGTSEFRVLVTDDTCEVSAETMTDGTVDFTGT